MLPIRGVYEIVIRVKDLPRAEAFYKGVLGLEEGIRDDKRNWHCRLGKTIHETSRNSTKIVRVGSCDFDRAFLALRLCHLLV